MSKALRTAIDIPPDVFGDVLKDMRHLTNWSPSYTILSGKEPPCFKEFMSLMECHMSSVERNCSNKYAKFVKCMEKCGL
jgi:hypothetical protein